MKCKHEWIDTEDGSKDKICIRCFKRAKQAVAYYPVAQPIMQPLTPDLAQPMLRETITINTGASNLGKVTVYKDDLLRETQKQFGLRQNYLT